MCSIAGVRPLTKWMKYAGAAFLTAATMLCALTIAIAREGDHLGKYEWAVPYLIGVILLCFVCGVVSLVTTGRQEEKRNNAPPPPPPAVSVHLENIGNPVHDQSSRQNAAVAQPPKPEPSQPNVKFLGIRSVRLDFIHHHTLQVCSYHEDSEGKLKGTVARFRNEAIFGTTVKALHDVRAQLKLFDETGIELGHSARAAWLGHKSFIVDLIPGGDTQCVILLIQDEANGFTISSKEISIYNNAIREHFREMVNPPHEIEISLLDARDQLIIQPLRAKLSISGMDISYKV